jgi:hypothetical protein
MAAGLERDIGGSAFCRAARDLERHSFGMGAAAVLGRALPDDVSVFDQDTADGGIFRRASRLRRAKFKGAPHVVFMSEFRHSFS